ncbi:MAG: hypothetical protein COU66_01115 [Candidatus Pacebacteria bacterium CG10_big_fil_rev_8_21_14_0_10_44_11]|nr:MAG: hypothetical protein COU66_01115 [Candidatus Pacebacteria bacterium CG10_big_fil_rev_8_21_14_0_10_44_11]
MKSSVVAVWLTLIILASSWSIFRPGIFYVHDYLHVSRISEMANALQDGHVPVRWSQNFGYGFGMPLFEFYGPLPYYLGALFFLAGLPVIVSFKLLMLIANFGTAVGSFKLGKQLYGRAGGLLVAASVTLAPYRAVDLFVRGALSEIWGIMAIVWISYYLWQVLNGVSKSWVGLIISLSVLFLSHNLLTLLFLPFSLFIGLIFLGFQLINLKHRQSLNSFAVWQRMITVGFAYLVAVGLSLFYLLPAFAEKDLTKVQATVTGGYFDYSIHFVYLRQFLADNWGYGGSSWGPTDGISFYLGLGQLILLVAGLFLIGYQVFWQYKNTQQLSWQKLTLLCSFYLLLAVSLLMTTQKSNFVWQSSSLLQFVQFPWRFLSISCFFIGLVSPVCLYAVNSRFKRWFFTWLLLLLLLVNARYFRPEAQLDHPEKYYTTDPYQISQELSSVLPDYLPKTFPDQPPVMVELASCDQGCERIETILNKTQEKTWSVWSSVATTLTVHLSYYPGWQVRVNGLSVPIQDNKGLVSAQIPAGHSSITISFLKTPIRAWSDRISLASLIVFGLAVVVQSFVSKRNYFHVSR